MEALGGSRARFVQLLTLAAAGMGTTVRGKWGNVDERSILIVSHHSSPVLRSIQIEGGTEGSESPEVVLDTGALNILAIYEKLKSHQVSVL